MSDIEKGFEVFADECYFLLNHSDLVSDMDHLTTNDNQSNDSNTTENNVIAHSDDDNQTKKTITNEHDKEKIAAIMTEESVQLQKQELKENIIKSGCYLSPDGIHTLNPRDPPPKIVIVGMLVDRRVTPNRSKNKATSLNLTSYQLPMNLLAEERNNNIGLRNDEPLNIDTVLDLMGAWWRNCVVFGTGFWYGSPVPKKHI